MIVPDRDKFDLMLSKTITKQEQESKKWLQMVGEYEFSKCIYIPKIIFNPTQEKNNQYDQLQEVTVQPLSMR